MIGKLIGILWVLRTRLISVVNGMLTSHLIFLYIIWMMRNISKIEFNLITVQKAATYSVYYISVGSSTRFECWHSSSGARTTVITAPDID